jgi:glyoxalase family protein
MPINGLHHVTAIAGPAQRNLDFYVRTLGLRLVKKTVNFDDPGTYHFYFGDGTGQPGTILTFFPWANAAQGRPGCGEAHETSFRVPEGSLAHWAERFADAGVDFDMPVVRFGHEVLALRDPDGMRLSLVAVPAIADEAAWTSDGISPAHAIRGFHGVTLVVADPARTGHVLGDVFGFAATATESGVTRWQAPGTAPGSVVDLRRTDDIARGRQGAGTVHHIAFRAADDAAQAVMVARLAAEHGLRTTEQKDRNYFRSVYFREPGGVLFEIATDVPGFAADEPVETLGTALKLPAFLEPRRAAIEAHLPAVR